MSQRTATIESLPMAFEVVKAMRADGLEWGEGYRPLGRQALAEIIQGRMAEAVDDWLDSLDGSAMRDRPCHPGRLRAWALNPQGGRGLVGPARPQGLGLDREPRCQDPG